MAHYIKYQDSHFRNSVKKALETVGRILEHGRDPKLADEEPHVYENKYELVEFVTNTGIASVSSIWSTLGLSADDHIVVDQWLKQQKKAVRLRFQANETCTFLKEEDVKVEDPNRTETTTVTNKSSSSLLFSSGKEETVTTKVFRNVKEFHWKVLVQYKLVMFAGTDVDGGIVLQQRSTETVLATQGSKTTAAAPPHRVHQPIDIDISWSLRNVTDGACTFRVNRECDECRTPRRNKETAAAVQFYQCLLLWSRSVHHYFSFLETKVLSKDNPVIPRRKTSHGKKNPSGIMEPGSTGTMEGLAKEPFFNGKRIRIVEFDKSNQRYKAEPVDTTLGLPGTLSIKPANIKPDVSPGSVQDGPPLSSISDADVFVPIIPIMEKGSVMSDDASDLLQEHTRSLDECIEGLYRTYPAKQLMKQISAAEASLVLVCTHLEHLSQRYIQSVEYVEDMLRQQLVAAIGKEIGPSDFDQFMKFHYPKLLQSQYVPVPFSHAIRRPGHYPNGILSIETDPNDINIRRGDTSEKAEPIETFVRALRRDDATTTTPLLRVPIDASTNVEITGDRFLHGWMQHDFKSSTSQQQPKLNLACRARQFSSFLVLIGTMAGPDKFEPKEAIILQNKDEVLIPLLTTVLPSAKEFKDAIESLSPEQQDFAKAFRGMQLESSVFGVCIVQIKPQLEKLLRLPDGALTKEIQLTQNLMSLFVEYQVPSDLLTYDGRDDDSCSQEEKIAIVKGHVESVLKMIDESKKKQLKEEEMMADMRTEMAHKAQSEQQSLITGNHLEIERMPGASPLTLMRANDNCSLTSTSDVSSMPIRMAKEMSSVQERRAPSKNPLQKLAKKKAPAAVKPMMMMPPEPSVASVHSKQAQQSIAPQSMPQTVHSESSKPQAPNQLSPPPTNNSTSCDNDFTLIPVELDRKLEKLDTDNSLRSTIIKTGKTWTRKRQENFLTGSQTTTLGSGNIDMERKQAIDLLDAISRSGTLSIDCAELHVFVAVSHCFSNDLMGSVVLDNINPIAKVEKSCLLLASTIHNISAPDCLLKNSLDVQRLTSAFPALFDDSGS